MKNFRFQFKNAAIIVACFAVCIMFSGCSKIFNDNMTILFTDIPSEYNGRSAATWVLCIDGTSKNTLLFAEGKSRVITNGKVLIDLFYRRGEFGSGGWTAKDKGEYIIKLQIFVMPDGDFWGGESDLINITKKNTTISFKSLKKYDWY